MLSKGRLKKSPPGLLMSLFAAGRVPELKSSKQVIREFFCFVPRSHRSDTRAPFYDH